MTTATVVTMRVADSKPAGESLVLSCDGCGEPVWVTDTTAERLVEYEDHEILCNVCVAPILEAEGIDNIDIVMADRSLQPFFNDNRKEMLEWMIRRGKGEQGST